jgi:hypothetical protein
VSSWLHIIFLGVLATPAKADGNAPLVLWLQMELLLCMGRIPSLTARS